MTPAGPTGGDERVRLIEAIAALRFLAHVSNGPQGVPLDEADGKYLTEAARRVETGALGHGSTVTATVARLLREIIPAVAEVAAAAGAVAAQDPAPRGEPDAWVASPASRQHREVTFDPDEAAMWEHHEGRRVVGLYRRPVPAPVVPDEADQATAEVDYISDEGTAYRVTINGTTWRSGPEETAEDLRREVQAHAALLRARLVPPTGGDR